MNRWQKIAWFNLAVLTSMLAICGAMATRMPLKDAITASPPLTFVIVPALLLVGMAEAVFFRKKSQDLECDERDSQIHRMSKYAGWIGFASSLFVGLMATYVSVGPKGSVNPFVLLSIALIGAVIFIMVASVAALIQYGWRAPDVT